jgi:hypothetical protein
MPCLRTARKKRFCLGTSGFRKQDPRHQIIRYCPLQHQTNKIKILLLTTELLPLAGASRQPKYKKKKEASKKGQNSSGSTLHKQNPPVIDTNTYKHDLSSMKQRGQLIQKGTPAPSPTTPSQPP